jgi:hypothetical protein
VSAALAVYEAIRQRMNSVESWKLKAMHWT